MHTMISQYIFVVVFQSLNCVRFFETPCISMSDSSVLYYIVNANLVMTIITIFIIQRQYNSLPRIWKKTSKRIYERKQNSLVSLWMGNQHAKINIYQQ